MVPSPKPGSLLTIAIVSARDGIHYSFSVFWWAFIVIISLAAPAPLGAATANLRDGTRVRLKLRYLMTTENVAKGDRVHFEVVEDVVAESQVVIAKGAPATGMVTQIKGAGNKKTKDAAVAFRILTVRFVDNQEINLRLVPRKGKKPAPVDYEVEERSAITGLAERVVGAEQGREYTAYTDADVRVKVAEPPPQ